MVYSSAVCSLSVLAICKMRFTMRLQFHEDSRALWDLNEKCRTFKLENPWVLSSFVPISHSKWILTEKCDMCVGFREAISQVCPSENNWSWGTCFHLVVRTGASPCWTDRVRNSRLQEDVWAMFARFPHVLTCKPATRTRCIPQHVQVANLLQSIRCQNKI